MAFVGYQCQMLDFIAAALRVLSLNAVLRRNVWGFLRRTLRTYRVGLSFFPQGLHGCLQRLNGTLEVTESLLVGVQFQVA